MFGRLESGRYGKRYARYFRWGRRQKTGASFAIKHCRCPAVAHGYCLNGFAQVPKHASYRRMRIPKEKPFTQHQKYTLLYVQNWRGVKCFLTWSRLKEQHAPVPETITGK